MRCLEGLWLYRVWVKEGLGEYVKDYSLESRGRHSNSTSGEAAFLETHFCLYCFELGQLDRYQSRGTYQLQEVPALVLTKHDGSLGHFSLCAEALVWLEYMLSCKMDNEIGNKEIDAV